MVEEWLGNLQRQMRKTDEIRPSETAKARPSLARATKAKIRNLMSVLFNHAIRWDFVARNPISGPNRGSGVRQSSKRMNVPDVLDVAEVQAIISKLQLRERVMLFLDMVTGLRRGELTGLKWQDIDFENLQIDVQRSVVDQVVGRWKTEHRKSPYPSTNTRWATFSLGFAKRHFESRRIGYLQQTAGGPARTWEAAALAIHGHAVPHRPGCATSRYSKASRLAYVPAHLCDPSQGEWGRRQSCAGITASRVKSGHIGHLRSGADAGETSRATEGGCDGA